MAVFDEAEVVKELIRLPEWRFDGNSLVRDFAFPDFVGAMKFVNDVATEAERAGHHPDIDIRWNRVRLALASHDAGGITEKDFNLAKGIGLLVNDPAQ